MAIRWAIANGNWSNITTWNGGTLPVSNDDVFADGKTVTIDQNIIVNSLDTRQRSGGISSGSFVVSQSGIYITASQITSGNSNCLNINLSIGQDCYVFGNITNATYSTAGLISTYH